MNAEKQTAFPARKITLQETKINSMNIEKNWTSNKMMEEKCEAYKKKRHPRLYIKSKTYAAATAKTNP